MSNCEILENSGDYTMHDIIKMSVITKLIISQNIFKSATNHVKFSFMNSIFFKNSVTNQIMVDIYFKM